MSAPVFLAVYGTLKSGLGNHGLLAQATLVGTDSLSQISLYDIGPYPGARLEASAGIEVEVYAITPIQLARLDLLEEYDPIAPEHSLYTRELVQTRFGEAWVYLYQGDVDGKPFLQHGAWQPRSHNREIQDSEETA